MGRESGVLATAACGKWHVLLGDDLEIQVDTPNVTFSFILREDVLKEVLEFCDHKRKEVCIGRYGSWWTGVKIHLLWDEEFPDTRAFVKAWKSNTHLLKFTLADDDLVNLKECAKQLLADMAGYAKR